MNILVSLDSNYVDQLCVMLKSLLISHPSERLDIYVAQTSLTEQDFTKMNQVVAGFDGEIHNIVIPEDMFSEAPITDRYPKEMYYRIFAANYLPKHLDKILYLDPDIVIINNLRELYELDMDNQYFAAASHVSEPLKKVNELRLNMPEDSTYINSGVLLMNLKLLRQEQDINEVYEYIKKNQLLLILPDQDVLNGIYAHKTIHIDPLKYNLSDRYLNIYNFSLKNIGDRKNLRWVTHNTSILHYCGRNKPWNTNYYGNLGTFYYYFENLVNKKINQA